MEELAEVVVEVDFLVGLVRGEEVTSGEPEPPISLAADEDRVGDVFIDGGVEDVEDGVVGGLPGHVSRGGDEGAVDVPR
jgi:hypothetical protein